MRAEQRGQEYYDHLALACGGTIASPALPPSARGGLVAVVVSVVAVVVLCGCRTLPLRNLPLSLGMLRSRCWGATNNHLHSVGGMGAACARRSTATTHSALLLRHAHNGSRFAGNCLTHAAHGLAGALVCYYQIFTCRTRSDLNDTHHHASLRFRVRLCCCLCGVELGEMLGCAVFFCCMARADRGDKPCRFQNVGPRGGTPDV